MGPVYSVAHRNTTGQHTVLYVRCTYRQHELRSDQCPYAVSSLPLLPSYSSAPRSAHHIVVAAPPISRARPTGNSLVLARPGRSACAWSLPLGATDRSEPDDLGKRSEARTTSTWRWTPRWQPGFLDPSIAVTDALFNSSWAKANPVFRTLNTLDYR